MVHIRHLKTIQSEENSFEVPRQCKTEKHLKKDQKLHNLRIRGCRKRPWAWDNILWCLMHPYTPNHAPRAWTLMTVHYTLYLESLLVKFLVYFY